MGYVPGGVEELAVSVSTDVPVTAIEEALKLPFSPGTEETPSRLREIFPEIPPHPNVARLTVACPVDPVVVPAYVLEVSQNSFACADTLQVVGAAVAFHEELVSCPVTLCQPVRLMALPDFGAGTMKALVVAPE